MRSLLEHAFVVLTDHFGKEIHMRGSNRWIIGGLAVCAFLDIAFQSNLGSELQAQDMTDKAPVAQMATPDISLDQANTALMAAAKKAQDMGLKQDLAVVDAGGNLKAFMRMDGAWLGSIDIAIKKAKTARYFDMPSGDLGKLSQPGKPLYQIEVTNQGLVSFPGGVPLKIAGAIVGAIGSSGSTVDNDLKVAEAGAAVVK